MGKEVKVVEIEVVDGKPVVRGTVGEVAFEAAPFQDVVAYIDSRKPRV